MKLTTPRSAFRDVRSLAIGFVLLLATVLLAAPGVSISGDSVPPAKTISADPLTVSAPPSPRFHAARHFLKTSLIAPLFAPTVMATKSASLFTDVNSDGNVDPGDTIKYAVDIAVSGMDAANVVFDDTLDANTALVGGSLAASPVAVDDTYPQTVIGNVSINSANIPYSVVTNDFLGVNPQATITAFDATSAHGGTVSMTPSGAGIGQFTYNPPAGYEGTDTFTYTLSDNSNATSAATNRTATVTLTVSGMVWFINNAAGSNGDGRLSSPFNSLANFQSVNDGASGHPAANDNIFLYESGTAYVGPVTLLSGQKLIGQDATISLSAITGLTPPSGSVAFPMMNSGNGTITKITSASNAINLTNGSTGNLLRGLTVGTTTGIGINGTNFGTLTVTEAPMADNPNRLGQALSLTGPGTLAATFSSIESKDSANRGISLTNVGGSLTSTTTTVTNPSGSGTNGIGIFVDTSSATLSFGTSSVTGSAGTGISLTTNTGTITFGALTVTPDAGQKGFVATNNSNTITIASGSITTSNNTAVEITKASGTTPLAISLTSVSANGGTNGINISGTTGSFTITGNGNTSVGGDNSGGTIQNTTGHGILLNNMQNPSFTNINVTNIALSGIYGTNVTNFTLANSKVDGVNTSHTANDSDVAFNASAGGSTENNLSGTVSITKNVINNSYQDGVSIKNFGGTISSLTITGNSLTSSTNDQLTFGSAIAIVANRNPLGGNFSTITGGTISGNTINNFTHGGGVLVIGGTGAAGGVHGGGNIASLANPFIINDNTITGAGPGIAGIGTNGVQVTVGNYSDGFFSIGASGHPNTITNVAGNGVAASKFGNNSGSGTNASKFIVAYNVINANNTANSAGINSGADNGTVATDTPTLYLDIHNNTVSNTTGNGILSTIRSTNGTGFFSITNNTVNQPIQGTTAVGIRVDSGNGSEGSGGGATLCLTISGNTTTGGKNGSGTIQAPGIGLRQEHASGSNACGCVSIFNINGLTPNPASDGGQMEGYVNGQNPGSASGVNFGVGGTASISSGATYHAGNCTLIASLPSGGFQTESLGPITDQSEGVDGQEPALRAPHGQAPPDDAVRKLTQPELNWMAQAALERWQQAGLSAEDLTRLQAVTFEVADLPAGQMAAADGLHVKIDETAAGYGWFVDQTPQEDSEFLVPVAGRELQTSEYSAAYGRVDLLTVLLRQLGQVYLQGQQRVPKALRPLMDSTLSPGVRRLPDAAAITLNLSSRVHEGATEGSTSELSAAQPVTTEMAGRLPVAYDADAANAGGLRYAMLRRPAAVAAAAMFADMVSQAIGTVPVGKHAIVTFKATINDPYQGATNQVSNTATVTGTGFSVNSNTAMTTVDLPDVSVAVAPASVAEDSGSGLVYTFTREAAKPYALTVNFSVGGTATFNTDYTQTGAASFTASSGTVTIAAGSSTAMVTVTPTADTTVEPNETVLLTVTSGIGYDVGVPPAATGTITNDDTDVSVAVSPASVAEDGASNLVYTFTRNGVTTNALTVNFTVGGTATFNTDYTQTGAATFTVASGTVTFSAGSTTATVTIDPTADSTVEPDETVILTVTSGTGYNVANPNTATGTITNDDTDVTLAVSPTAVAEDGASNLVYTFTRSGVTTNALTVNFTVGGTATFNTDYTQTGAATFTASSGTVTIAAGQTTATVTIDPTADTTVEPDETVILTVTSGSGYNAANPNAATGTITNDDTSVSVAVSPSSVAEDSGTGLVYTFTRAGVTSNALTVNFTVGGTATFNTDYTQTGAATFTASSGTVSFSAGGTTASVTVTPTADTSFEPDETVMLTVTSGSGYTVGSPSSASGTIANDDTEVSVAVSPSSVNEDGAQNLVYTFTRAGLTTGTLTVNFTVSGTATFNTDYTQTGAATFTASSGTVTIAAGQTMATVTIDPTADSTVEPDETAVLTVTGGSGYTVGSPAAATGTISNDDTDVTVAVSPTAVAEDGAANLVYTFTRNGVTSGALTVNFTVGGTATFNNDYTVTGAASFTASTGTVTFSAGNSAATVTVDPTADMAGEPDETVILTLASGTGYNVSSPNSASGTILNDDTAVSVAVSPASVAEDSGSSLVYSFTRSGDTSTPLTVNFSVGGTATFSSDYTQMGAATFIASSGTVMIGIGSSMATVTITPMADSTVEVDETVILTVTSGSGYNPGAPMAATGTITNDDTDVTLAVSPASVNEDGASNLVYTFTRNGVTTNALTVNFTVGGTATFNTDYTATGADSFTASSGAVTIAAGQTTATVTVDPTADSTVEPDETVILTIASGSGYNLGSPSAATGTIANDDTDITVAVSPSSVSEDGASNLVYTFTRAGVTSGALTVNFSVSGTATFNTDYTVTGASSFSAINGSVTFSAGSTTATVTVDPTADLTPEPDETVILTITSGSGYNISMPDTATGTIANDDTSVTVAVSPSSVSEDGAANLVYTFTRTGVTDNALTVNFLVSGTATLNSDYTQTGAATFTASSGTVTFSAGVSTVQVTVDPTADNTVEPDESVTLMVAPGAGYNIGVPDTATGTILNDDTDVTLAVSPASVNEDGASNLVYTFTRSGVTSGALTVSFTVGGTATFNTDYTQSGAATFNASTGTVSFSAGSTTATVTVDPTADSTVEPDETVILTVTSGSGYNVGSPSAATGTITNDDTDVTLAVSPAAVSEVGSSSLVYTFTRTGVTSNALTVNFTVGGTATFNTDYTQAGAASFTTSSGTVSFASGSPTATVSLTPINDVLVEGDETAILTLTPGSGYTVGSPSVASGTILDNDTASIAFAAASLNAPEQSSPATVGVSLTISANGSGGTPMLARSVSVNVQDLGSGTATGGTDYTFASPQTVTFASGDVTQTKNLSVAINNDSLSEGDETINLQLNSLADGSGGQVALVSPTAATVTIVDNDIDLKVTKMESADPVAAGSGPGNLTYTVKVKNVGLTAASGVTLSEVLTIPSGVTVDSVTVSAGSRVMNTATDYTWNLGNLAVNAEASLTAVLTVGATAQSGSNTICDTAQVTAANENRVNTSDDQASECTSVLAQADVALTGKADAPDPVCVGGNITYTIGFVNNGAGQGINTKVTDALPANTSFVSAAVMSGTGWTISQPSVGATSGNVVFSKGSTAAGETAILQVIVKVNNGVAHHTVITNSATTSSDILDPNPKNNTASAATTVDPVAPSINCPAPIILAAAQGQCQAVASFAPTTSDNCALASVVCAPASGTAFPVGTTTVSCTATDTAGNTASCSFVVKVNDTQPPAFAQGCPASINAVAQITCPMTTSQAVSYQTPAVTDNCAGATVSCVPPSGSVFTVGTTSVSCTATDASGNTASCSFAVKVWTACLQDESNPGNVCQFDAQTGEYQLCCNGVVVATGTGTLSVRGCVVQIDHIKGNRKVSIRADLSVKRGTATILIANQTTCGITDQNMANNNCQCPTGAKP
ncbi:MAG TPA: Calx-beta domain-containing protein [Blastocatellia bacterium]|nr:Calx-beta domain-containing protein [Blastocatellia bacterium]